MSFTARGNGNFFCELTIIISVQLTMSHTAVNQQVMKVANSKSFHQSARDREKKTANEADKFRVAVARLLRVDHETEAIESKNDWISRQIVALY